MNTSSYPKSLRPVLTAEGLVSTFDPWGDARLDRSNRLEVVASVFENIDREELVGLVVDGSALAGELDQPPVIRRLAATVAVVAESALTGSTDWDAVVDLADAASAVNNTKRNSNDNQD